MYDNVEFADFWLIGAGEMAVAYARVLQAKGIEFTCIGRGEESAKKFEEETQKKVVIGGIEKVLENTTNRPRYAVVAVNPMFLATTTLLLLDAGIKEILVEKPACFYRNELEQMVAKSHAQQANVYVGYNRRFYSSVMRAREIISQDGGVSSFNFEFTEWAHVIEKVDRTDIEKQEWFLANSTHVVDLAFHLGGKPKEISSFISGSLNWHPRASAYAGAGFTDDNTLFSYQANWDAPGRWGVEILTKQHRLYFCPLEELRIQKKGTVLVEKVEIDNTLDEKYKPGLYKQLEAFYDGTNKPLLKTLEEHLVDFKTYESIENQSR